MKAIKILTILLLFFTNCAISQGNGDELKQSFNYTATDSVEYQVDVTFKIDEEGKAVVLEVESDNPKLVAYVLEKFEKIEVSKDNYYRGKVMRYRFTFKLPPEDLAMKLHSYKDSNFIANFAANGKEEGHPNYES